MANPVSGFSALRLCGLTVFQENGFTVIPLNGYAGLRVNSLDERGAQPSSQFGSATAKRGHVYGCDCNGRKL